ncbi:hypothetical protein BD769DRAFT_1681891 [Suillus cothurnatus]|nr:hypothetical protein BD769DRAFT_1681891 [Suillus cothurnatus]
MYSYGRQPINALLDDNDLSHQPQPHHDGNLNSYYFVIAQVDQSHDPFLTPGQSSGDQTPAALFPNAPFSNPNFPGYASQSAHPFPDPNFIDLCTNLPDHYDPETVVSADEDPSMLFVDDPFQFTLDPLARYHPIYNPSAIPYQDSVPSHPSPSQYFHSFPPPIVSVDGLSTLAPGSEDIPPLGELPGLNEWLPLGDTFHLRELSPPPSHPSGSHSHQPSEKPLEIKFWPYPRAQTKLRCLTSVQGASDTAPSMVPLRRSHITPLQYSNKVQTHRRIFEDTRGTLIRSALSSCPFLTEQERKTAAQEALTLAANVYDDEYGSQWSAENVTEFYKLFMVPLSADITSTCKKIARAVAPIRYSLRPPIWSEASEPLYQIDKVKDLIEDPAFPLKYIFGNNSGDCGVGKMYPFENRIISTVAVDAILKLGYMPYITELDDSVFCTAATAVECTLQEPASGQLGVSIDFGVLFKPTYTSLMTYIQDHITTDEELSVQWTDFKNRIHARLIAIAAFCA